MWQIVVLIVTISTQQPYAAMTFKQGYISKDACHAAIPSIRSSVNQLLKYPGYTIAKTICVHNDGI
jgi:hypothetical protein